MSHDDLVKIRINQQNVGVIGLKKVMEEMAAVYADMPNDEIEAGLVKRLSKANYIPDGAKKAYGKALLREFNKFIGRPFEEDALGGLEIKVLGPGCARCDQLEMDVMEAAAEMNLPAAVDHVRDIKEIASYGVMGTPALIIDGKVTSVGTVPTKEQIKTWLSEFSAR
jgi:small redox-active disulfide protein 2